MANRRFIDFPIAATVGNNDIVLIWQDGLNKQTTKATLLQGSPQSLAGLTDVDIAALTNGQILQYNSTTSKWENVDRTDIFLSQLGDVTIVAPSNGQVLVYNSSTSKWENSSGGYVPYTGAVTTVNLGSQTIQAGSFVKTGGTAAQFLKANGSVDSTAYGTGSVTSVALTMPTAFSVAGSPITTAGTLAVTATGTTAQYIRGDGSLATFPGLTGFVPYTGATADVNLGTHDLAAERGTFTNNGSSDALTVNQTSGSGYGIIVTKGGNNEALYVSKTSGSGNAMTVIGGRTSLVDLALSSVTNTAGDFLTLSGGVVHKRTAAEVRTDIGAGTVTSVGLSSATSGVTIGSTPVTTSGTITLAIATASGSQNGLLSSTDWTTFNGKQNALTNPVTGTGTTNYLPKFTGSTTIGNSLLIDDGNKINLTTTNTTIASLNIDSTSLDHISLQANRFHLIGGSNFHITNNSYYDGSFKYSFAGIASKITIQSDGSFLYDNSVSGTVGAAVTFINRFNINNLGAAAFSSSVTAAGVGTFGRDATTVLGYFGDPNTVGNKYISFSRASAKTDIVNIQGIDAGVGGANIALQALGGNVGIGTASPSARLHLKAPSNDQVLRFEQQNDITSQYYFNIDSAVNGALSLVTNYLGGNVVGFCQNRNGNVLIGTTTGGASKLRIVGLPTSAVGLSSGDVYNLAGTLMIA